MNNTGFDFDEVIDRSGTASEKWDKYRGGDIIPLWVADMDFRSPPAVIAALRERIDHGVFGYTAPPDELAETVVSYLKREYGWDVEPGWLVWLPGLVCGLNVACRAAGSQGDEIITFTPVYPPFMTAPELSGRTSVKVPLRQNNQLWEIDLPALEGAITQRTSMLMLCNPHNPVGRVWTRDELTGLLEMAERHDLIICSDEIHSGLVLDPDKKHIPFAMLSEAAASRSITLNAPSKTFNIPGLGCSFAVISEPSLRRGFKKVMNGIVPHVNLLGYTATQAAYQHGEQWRCELVEYLRGNRDLVMQELGGISGIALTPVEATYLAWIDVRKNGIEQPVRFFEQAGVGLSDGAAFGLPGFVRLNFGCRRELLAEALGRIKAVL